MNLFFVIPNMKTCSLLHKDSNIVIVNKDEGVSIPECLDELTSNLILTTRKRIPNNFVVLPINPLDKAVSGIQIFGLNPNIARELMKLWDTPFITREFLGLAKGDITEPFTLCFPLEDDQKNKQTAVTHFAPIHGFNMVTYLKIWTETDCNRQIRRHFSRRCMNIIGDRKHGQKKWNDLFEKQFGLTRIFLHAHYLKLNLKGYHKALEINCPLPMELQSVLEKLFCLCQPPVMVANCHERQ